MAEINLKGTTTGNNASDGLTWAAGKATLAVAGSDAGAGGTVWCDASTAEASTGASQTVSAGTRDDPQKIVSGTPAGGSGLSAVAKGYAVTLTGGTFNIALNGWLYVEGIVFTCGSSTNNGHIQMAMTSENIVRAKDCDFILGGNNASGKIDVGGVAQEGTRVDWGNCGVKFAHASQGIAVTSCDFRWTGGSVLAGSTALASYLFYTGSSSARGILIEMTGVDLRNMGASCPLMTSPQGQVRGRARGCIMPTGWFAASQPVAGIGSSNVRWDLYDCAEIDGTGTPFWIQDQFGSAKQELSINRTGQGDARGAYSIKLESTANPQWPQLGFRMHEQLINNAEVGVAKKLTIEVTSSTLLKARDLVLRARYQGSANSTLYTEVTSAPSVIAADSNIATSSAPWNNAATNRQKLEVTFTPQKAGPILWDLMLFAAGTTVYVAPRPSIANA